MRIRPAEPSDAAAITDVLADSAAAAYEEILPEVHLERAFVDLDDDALAERLTETREDDQVVYLVAVADEDVVGFAQVLWGSRRPEHVEAGVAFLQSLYVASSHWGEEIGSGLLDAAVARLPSETEQLRLGVLSGNDVGVGFYETYGFEQAGQGTFEIEATSYETDIYVMAV